MKGSADQVPEQRDQAGEISGSEAERALWIKACAAAKTEDLDRFIDSLANQPVYCRLRGPEIGLALVRGRIGGDGRNFNLGEMTVTRCTVRLTHLSGRPDGDVLGHGFVAGRRPRHAELSAVVDGLCQADREIRALAKATLVDPVLAREAARAEQQRHESDATRVDFFHRRQG